MKAVAKAVFVALFLTMAVGSWSQESQPAAAAAPDAAPAATTGDGFGLGLGIGYESIPATGGAVPVGWQKLSLVPDVAIGKFGIGFDLTLHFRFNGGADGQSFEVRPDDWVVYPLTAQRFFEVYLPKIKYIRYGVKGDPVYLQMGTLYGATMGNGFIVNAYSNALYQPNRTIFGAAFDLDGAAFSFPYIGFETLFGNLAAFDLMSARLYVRPGADSDAEILKGLQIGVSAAVDTNPHYYSDDSAISANPGRETVVVWGVDLRVPLVAGDALSMALLGDMAFQKANVGGQLGLGGRIISVFNYLAAVRYVGDNFIPDYFNASYDLLREQELAVYDATGVVSPAYAGWLFKAGFGVLNDSLVFSLGMDGPFVVDPNVLTKNPNLQASLLLKEGVLDGFSFQALYSKHYLRSWQDLVDPTNATISVMAGYKMGPARISLIYNIQYDPNLVGSGQPWVVTSRLETAIDIGRF